VREQGKSRQTKQWQRPLAGSGLSSWIGSHSSWHQVSPATMRKRVQNDRRKEPNSMGSSSRNIVTPTTESAQIGFILLTFSHAGSPSSTHQK
jgi:hypothetical protein